MRRVFLFLAVLLVGAPALGAELPLRPPGFEPPEAEDAEAPRQETTIEDLLEELAMAESEDDARNTERRIHDRWMRSGSPTADLLYDRSGKAMDEDETETAKELVDNLTELAPDFAEGWHRRAIVAMAREDFEEAVVALRQVLVLQPKHFIALAELGSILEEFGDQENALAAYREAVAIDPYIEGIEDRIRELSRAVEGQGI